MPVARSRYGVSRFTWLLIFSCALMVDAWVMAAEVGDPVAADTGGETVVGGIGKTGGMGGAAAPNHAPLRLVELFTSHGCSSCPAADELLGELLRQDPALMALEYHVDYWNTLVHGGAGSWIDPFSKPEYTDRQRSYQSAGLSGRPGVYTPQAIVNGREAAVGSDRAHLQRALSVPVRQQLDIEIIQRTVPSLSEVDELQITLHADAAAIDALQGTPVVLVRYLDQAKTRVTAGENQHRELINQHIVFDTLTLGQISSHSDLQFVAAAPGANEGCLVVVQHEALSPVYAAARCP